MLRVRFKQSLGLAVCVGVAFRMLTAHAQLQPQPPELPNFVQPTVVGSLTNSGGAVLSWLASSSQNWVSLSAMSGTLAAGDSTNVTVSINSDANNLAPGSYADNVTFTSLTNGNGTRNRTAILTVTEAPAAPSSLTATAVSTNRINLSWADNSNNEDGFKVERALDNGGSPGTWAEIAAVGMNVTNYSDTGLPPDRTYWYRVRAYNAGGNSDYSNQASATTPVLCPAYVVGWGLNNYGQTNAPPGLTNVVAIAAGFYHNLALKSDGTVVGWGNNGNGQTNSPAGLSNVVVIAAGGLHSLALKSDGTVVGWGNNSYGQNNVPPGLTNVVLIAAGYYYNLALKGDGTVVGWGYNSNGQTNSPAGLSNVVAIAAGEYHSLALKSDGTVVGWGDNSYGQTNSPAGLSNVVAIAAGGRHSLALKSDGTVVGWGDNGYGQTNSPAGLSSVVAIAAGGLHSLALKSDSTVVGWGDNGNGQTNSPAGLSNVVAIAAGGYHSLALKYVCFTRPNAPSALTATAASANKIDLSWTDSSSNEDGFRIERSADGTNFTQIAQVLANTASYRDACVWPSTTYYYRVRACNAGGNSDYSNQASATTPVLCPTYVVGWGDNDYGQTSVPPSLTNVVAIAGGYYHSLALKSDGTVVGWGDNGSGQTNSPAGLSNVVAIAAGYYHNLALKSDSTVVGWGDNGNGQTNSPAGLSNVVAIAAGGWHSLALKSNGTVVGWGWNGNGQTNSPAGLAGVVAIAAGGWHSLALRSDGTVVGWGYNSNGQTNSPAGLSNVVAIAAGYYYNLALKGDGTVVGWGLNNYGQTNSPAGLTGVMTIAAGAWHSLALGCVSLPSAPSGLTATAASASEIDLSWTDNSNNEDGFKIERSTDGTNFTQIAQVSANNTTYRNTGLWPGTTYYYRVRAYNVAGDSDYGNQASATTPMLCPTYVVGWGYNNHGQTNVPPSLTNVVAIAGGYYHSLALKSDGTVVGWGFNNHGQTNVPPSLTNVVAIAGGYYHSLALKSDGTVVGWGDNGWGQTNSPAGLSNVVGIAAGMDDSLALKSDGTVVEWGSNNYGQTNSPAGLSGVVAIAADYYHSLALKSDGTVVGWGDNSYYQTNSPAGLSNVVAIAAGRFHSLALKSDGTVVGWGDNDQGQASPPAGLTNVVAIAAGGFHSLALKSDGTVVGWGSNNYGQTNSPAGLAGVVAIAAGGYHNLALTWSCLISPPSALTATSVSLSQIDLSWTDNSGNEDGFKIERALDNGGSPGAWTQIATVNSNVTTYSDTGLSPNTTYWYRVRAYNGYGDSDYSNPVSATAVNPGILAVTPVDGLTASGPQGGPFSPSSQSYTLSNTGGNPLNWCVSKSASWLTLSATIGSLAVGSNTTVTVSINTNANSLAPSNYTDTVAFSNTTYRVGSTARTVSLTVNAIGILSVTPSAGLTSRGPAGGPFSPASQVYTLANSGAAGLDWSATNTAAWVSLSATSGSLAAGGNTTVTVSINANGLADGSYTDNVTLVNLTYGSGTTNRTVILTVTEIPAAPSGLTATAVFPDQINLSWTDNSINEDGFKIERALDNGGSPGAWTQIATVNSNVTAYSDTGLSPNTTYWYRVRAYNSYGDSDYSNQADAVTPAPCIGPVVGWGDESIGQTPPPAGLTGVVVAIAAGYFHSLALKSDGTVVGWGDNNNGQATPPAGLTGVVAIAAGGYHSLALRNDGTIVGWGFNGYGQATMPAGLTGVVAIAAGSGHSLALRSDGTVVAWGWNCFGQTNSPAGLTGAVAIAAGFYHSLALKNDGTVVGWGDNSYGNQATPPAGLTGVVAIAAGGYHSLALKSDRTVVGWGDNNYGQTNCPAGLSNVVAIAAGVYHSLALKSDGTVVGWGDNDSGQAGPPVCSLSGVVAISAGWSHSLALTSPYFFSPPSALTATAASASEIDLNWSDNSNNEDGFKIERALDNGGSPGAWTQIATMGADIISYSDMGLPPNTMYWYRVRAYNAGGNSDYSNQASAETLSLWWQQWQLNYFGCTNCPQAAATADPDGDGQNNLAEFLAGTDPTNSASAFRIISLTLEGDDVRVTWTMGDDKTNALQVTAGDASGGFTNDFSDIFTVTNTFGSVTNYLDLGAATNAPARFYRVRLVP